MDSVWFRPRFAVASVVLFCLFSLSTAEIVEAGPIVGDQVPNISVRIGEEPEAWSYSAPVGDYRPATNADGGYELDSSREFDVLGNRAHVEIRELQFDPDPFVLNNILVTNVTGGTQLFTVSVGLVTAFGAPNLISGNVRTNVIDGGADGGTVATSGGMSLYQARIDGSNVATLQDDPFSVVAPVSGSNTLAASFGPSVNGVAVTSDISIQLRFTLTAGDTAAILSRFDVTVIPEPSSLVLLLLAISAGLISARSARLV